MNALAGCMYGLLELLGPERCVICAAAVGTAPPAIIAPGGAPGLRWWDAAHLCGNCQARWRGPPRYGVVVDFDLRTSTVADAELVRAVGAWKYHGLRGLGRPLAALLAPVLATARNCNPDVTLVPIPLHAHRRRERGFDQCRQLAVLAAREAGLPVLTDILVRRRATRQQASCPVEGRARRQNMAAAFAARPPGAGQCGRLILLDDLVTTGATLAAAGEALTAAGWEVVSLVAVGQAARLLLADRG